MQDPTPMVWGAMDRFAHGQILGSFHNKSER